jgi:eukaryotic-like serine/threonine-protein kinase
VDQVMVGSTDLQAALSGRYRLERVLGKGGMATVYLAEDFERSDPVAIKVLRPDLAALLGPTRFHREISIITRLQHPNILPLLDSSEAGPFLYYVMPYVAGNSLQQLLELNESLSIDRTMAVTRDLISGIEYAHSQNVLHRDIKPGNVLLDGQRALLCDFGMARAVEEAGGESHSSSGLVVGTPAYMSPEQATGGDVGRPADIYALGCVIYEMLTGEPPFTGVTSQAIIARHIGEPVRAIRTVRPDVPPDMELAILAALSKDPGGRPGSATKLAQELGL